MNYIDALLVALRALRVNVMRSVLTTLGIIIGVAAVISMVSVGAGAEARVAEVINNLGANLIFVLNGTTTSGGASLGGEAMPTVTEDDAEAIGREIPDVQVSAPLVRGSAQVVFGHLNWSTVAYGITPEYFEAREWEIESGRIFTQEEIRGAGKVVLLGRTVVDNLFQGQNPIGEMVRIRRVPFTVIGVMKAKGQTPSGQDQDDTIFMPLGTARKRVLGGRQFGGRIVGAIVVKSYLSERVNHVEEQVTELLRQRHRLRAGQDNDFRTTNLSQFLEARAESSRTMSMLLAAVASVSLIVGGIGIMNIMLVSVTERRREIGLRMSVGARGRDVLIQFLIEAVTLSLLGGLMGVMLGIGGSAAIAKLGGFPMIIGLNSVLLAFCFSAAVGVFFGFYPAYKASRLDPIEALRYE
ncbi:MAG: ABC transporter permease [Proteobacteria bacterium]|nr:ABC transporter permease [Pseudomonadota bacterium]